MQLESRANNDDRSARISTRHKFCRKRPCFPLIISARDFRGLLLDPVIALPFSHYPKGRQPIPGACAFHFLRLCQAPNPNIRCFIYHSSIKIVKIRSQIDPHPMEPVCSTREPEALQESSILVYCRIPKSFHELWLLRNLIFVSEFVAGISLLTVQFLHPDPTTEFSTASAPIRASNSSPYSSSF